MLILIVASLVIPQLAKHGARGGGERVDSASTTVEQTSGGDTIREIAPGSADTAAAQPTDVNAPQPSEEPRIKEIKPLNSDSAY